MKGSPDEGKGKYSAKLVSVTARKRKKGSLFVDLGVRQF